MALIESGEVKLGVAAVPFDLPATDGKRYSLESFEQADVLVMMFICNHCPYVKAVLERLCVLARETRSQGVAFVAISSNDASRYPDDSFEKMSELSRARNFPFPYLYDESQDVARAYGALCTPDFFVYDRQRKLSYRGRLDDSWKDAANVRRQDLRKAIEALLKGDKPAHEQIPSMGCSIKWK